MKFKEFIEEVVKAIETIVDDLFTTKPEYDESDIDGSIKKVKKRLKRILKANGKLQKKLEKSDEKVEKHKMASNKLRNAVSMMTERHDEAQGILEQLEELKE